MDDEQLTPLACTDNECSFPDPLDGSTEIVDYLRQQIQYWREQLDELHLKHDECIKQIKVLNDSIDQAHNENETLKHELDEKDALLSQERKELADDKFKLKQHIQQQEHKISDLERDLQSAEEKIKAYEKQLMNSAQSSNLTHSAGVSTSGVQSGCRACVKMTKELNALKLKYDEIIKDLELKNIQLSEENESMRNMEQETSLATITLECKELKQENLQLKHIIDDLERRLKTEIDEKLNLHKHNVQLTEEKTNLRRELKNMMQRNEELEKEGEKSRQQNQHQYTKANNLNHHKGAKYNGNKMSKLPEDDENVKYEGETRNEKFKNPEYRMRPRLRSLPTQNALRTSVFVKSNLLESTPKKGT